MTKNILLTFLCFTFIFNESKAALTYDVSITYSETVGSGGSAAENWTFGETTAGATGCEDFNSATGYYYSTRPEMRGSVLVTSKSYGNEVVYLDKNKTTCSGIVHEKDPLKRISWQNMGVVQDEEFGLTSLTCRASASNDCYGVITTFEERIERAYDLRFIDKNGKDGSRGQVISLYLYNYGNLQSTIEDGRAGKKGYPDIIQRNDLVKYCYQINDASNSSDPDTRKKPRVSTIKYNWNAFEQGTDGINGTLNGSEKAKATVIKGLDSSLRFWLETDFEGMWNEN